MALPSELADAADKLTELVEQADDEDVLLDEDNAPE